MKATIYVDDSAESPRSWDNMGTMACWHRKYNLGDVRPKESPTEWLKANAPKGSVVLPLYLYDHSGITMSTGSFNDPWDSGQVGWIICTPEKIRKEYNVTRITQKLRAQVEQMLISEVKTYDHYLTGNVYGFSLSDDEGEMVDSCAGFYGDDLDGMIEHAGKEHAEILKEAWEHRFG